MMDCCGYSMSSSDAFMQAHQYQAVLETRPSVGMSQKTPSCVYTLGGFLCPVHIEDGGQ
jgi:hypothetical protein